MNTPIPDYSELSEEDGYEVVLEGLKSQIDSMTLLQKAGRLISVGNSNREKHQAKLNQINAEITRRKESETATRNKGTQHG